MQQAKRSMALLRMRSWNSAGMSTITAVALILGIVAGKAVAAEKMSIWPENSPELEGVEAKHIPVLFLHHGPASESKKPAVLLCPAGGYKHHSNMSEIITWLNGLGIAVYQVKYRLPVYGYKHPAPMHDAQRAMRVIRSNAEKWGLDTSHIGVVGFSSGGHVASTLATHYDGGQADAEDPIERLTCRPDFVILVEAVITMQGPSCHFASRGRLLPNDPPTELVDLMSNELQVTVDTPPALLIASGQDRLVPADNSLNFFIALRRHNVAFSELHFFSHGGHMYVTPEWYPFGEGWLRRLGVLPPKDGKPWPKGDDKGAWESGNYMKGE